MLATIFAAYLAFVSACAVDSSPPGLQLRATELAALAPAKRSLRCNPCAEFVYHGPMGEVVRLEGDVQPNVVLLSSDITEALIYQHKQSDHITYWLAMIVRAEMMAPLKEISERFPGKIIAVSVDKRVVALTLGASLYPLLQIQASERSPLDEVMSGLGRKAELVPYGGDLVRALGAGPEGMIEYLRDQAKVD